MFHQKLQEVGAEYEISVGSENIEVNSKVVCKVGKYWYRATVLNLDELCEVRLVDVADIVKVAIHNVRKLEESSSVVTERLFLKKVGLPGIEPAGSGGWSANSIDILERVAKNKIVISKEGDKTDLVMLKVTNCNPFDLENISRKSVAQILLDGGLALKANTRKKCG